MSEHSIDSQWQRLREQRRTALIPYLTAGYPNRSASLEALRMLEAEGADFIEVGLPFSDPLADGPIIQQSTQIALNGGMTAAGALSLIREAGLSLPVVAFGYLNPILSYGLERFIAHAGEAGVAGLLLTDLPAGEDLGIERTVYASPLALIRLVAPTTDDSRLKVTLAGAQGFVYLISRLGVTGPQTTIGPQLQRAVERVRGATRLPLAIGFGIATGEQARAVSGLCDGVVVGSALVNRLNQGIESARELMQELAAGLRNGSDSLCGSNPT
ncbi:MAG: tryptophan synthase subunit alpha [Gemmatimonadota bacterium]|nr:MAG: tryptophan synthase subunit alpha [Gemmatimonadota bacterium]